MSKQLNMNFKDAAGADYKIGISYAGANWSKRPKPISRRNPVKSADAPPRPADFFRHHGVPTAHYARH